MHNLIKYILKEELSYPHLEVDVKMLIDDDLLEKKVFPDKTYYNITELKDVFPSVEDLQLLPVLSDLKVGYYTLENNGMQFYIDHYKFHNTNGPAIIYSDKSERWFVGDRIVAEKDYYDDEPRIFDSILWDKYFADTYNKQTLNENISNEELKSDIKMIIDDGLVDMEVHPDLTYIDRNQLKDIFPEISSNELSDALLSLGYGEVDISEYSYRYEYGGNLHNINGPAIIYANENYGKLWFIKGVEIAKLYYGHLLITKKQTWNKYFAKNYNRYPLNENISDEQLIQDIKMIIDDEMVDMEVYPDLTYVVIEELIEIFPGNHYYTLLDIVTMLGYGEIFVSEVGTKNYRNENGEKHNINGPAVIRSNGNKEWHIGDELIAFYSPSNPKIRVYYKGAWNQYFAKNYQH